MPSDSFSSSLAAARVGRLHRQFLDAAELYPHLRLLAARPNEPGDWPKFPSVHYGATIGLPNDVWKLLFNCLGHVYGAPFQPLSTVWLWIDGELWEGAFYNGGACAEAPELQEQYQGFMAALSELGRLADLAANQFKELPLPQWEDSLFLLRQNRSDRWLERVLGLPPLGEWLDECGMRINRLHSNVFMASARAIELLASQATDGTFGAITEPDQPHGPTIPRNATMDGANDQVAESPTPKKRKRSTAKGEGQAKLISSLTQHHKYANGSCLNQEPIGNNELAELAGVSTSTASAFFNRKFNKGEKDGYTRYRVVCGDVMQLVTALKLLNGEFSPHDLYGRRPVGERDLDDEE